MNFIINILFLIFFPFVLFFHIYNGYSFNDIKKKLGIISNLQKDKVTIIFHGVSVGEINALEKLVKKAREQFPNAYLVVTTGTNTGQNIAKKKFDSIVDFITYFPFDVPFCINNFINRLNPNAVYMMETEIWPNFINMCKKREVKLYIINGRISDRTFNSYKKLKFIFSSLLQKYSGIYTQSTEDLHKFIQLGANPNTTERMNNLKFDISKPKTNITFSSNGICLLAASTHSGEDKIVLEVYKSLKLKHDNLKLIIAPRHLTRLDEVEDIVRNYNYTYGFRSRNDNLVENNILILDTMGELSNFFAFADISYIGGSFNKTGGHNPLESIIFNKPVISGPSIHNFKDIYNIITKANAGFVVKSQSEFLQIADKLISDNKFYNATVEACSQVFESQQGALEFVLNNIKDTLF